MNIGVGQAGEWWVVLDGEAPVRTPRGTPVVSQHREMVEEIAADVARYGTDPTTRTTTFSLQASYLDFGVRVKRHVLEENTFAIWPDDLLVRRPAAPVAAGWLLAVWGPAPVDRAGFRDALRSLTLRQLMATMTAGHVLRTAVLGFRVVTTPADLVPLAMGACGRAFQAHDAGAAGEDGFSQVGGRTGRHVPSELDEAYCAGTCCARAVEDVEEFRRRCALLPLLDRMRRWSAWPEESLAAPRRD